MRKFTFLAAAALTAVAANAQNVTASNEPVIAQKPESIHWIIMSDGAQSAFEGVGSQMTYLGPNDEGRNLYIWSAGETLSGYDATYPCVDDEEGTYLSLEVANNDWFGAGYNIGESDPANLSMFNENTRLHLAYMTPSGNGPKSMYLTILDCDGKNTPAQVSLGEVFENHPLLGAAPTDDWQGIDISFADLKKLCPTFDWTGLDSFRGNIFAFGGPGGCLGNTFSFDALYFYNLAEGEGGEVEPGPDPVEDVIYLVGDMNGWNINGDEYPLIMVEPGVYSATFNIAALDKNENGKQWFRFYSALGDWDNNSIGSDTDNLTVSWTDGAFEGGIIVDSQNCWILEGWEGGDITFTVNLNDNTFIFTNLSGEEPGEEEPGEDGVASVTADARFFVVTANTININGGNGIELYNLNGQLVKKTNGCVLGINGMQKGVYVAKSGNKSQKVVVK